MIPAACRGPPIPKDFDHTRSGVVLSVLNAIAPEVDPNDIRDEPFAVHTRSRFPAREVGYWHPGPRN